MEDLKTKKAVCSFKKFAEKGRRQVQESAAFPETL